MFKKIYKGSIGEIVNLSVSSVNRILKTKGQEQEDYLELLACNVRQQYQPPEQIDHKLENMPSIGPDSSAMENGMTEDHYNNWPNDKGVSQVMGTSIYIYTNPCIVRS